MDSPFWQRLVDRYGGIEEARAEMRRRGSMRKKYGGGFGALKQLDPAKYAKIQRKASERGVAARQLKAEEK